MIGDEYPRFPKTLKVIQYAVLAEASTQRVDDLLELSEADVEILRMSGRSLAAFQNCRASPVRKNRSIRRFATWAILRMRSRRFMKTCNTWNLFRNLDDSEKLDMMRFFVYDIENLHF
jgi:hypothetical protein